MQNFRRCRAPAQVAVAAESLAPKILDLWHVNSQNNVGNGLVLTISASQIANHYAAQSPAASGDEFFSQDFWLAGSTSFVIDAYCVKGGSAGILKLDVMDAVTDVQISTVTEDLYSAVATYNFKVQVGLVTTGDRKVYLRGKTTAKNAASSGFLIPITCFMVRS